MTEKCTASCRDGSPCEAYPVTGEDKCRMHLGKSGDSHDGANNPNYEHGAFSEHLKSDLTESELAAFDDLTDGFEDPEHAHAIIKELAAEALLKYKRSADERFLREFRQIADTFNLAPNADHIEQEVSGEGGGPLEVVSVTNEVVSTDE